MKRPGYREAIEWIAYFDDTTWLDEPRPYDGEPIISVTACMIRDLFDVDDARLLKDLRRAIAKRERAS